MSLAPGSTVAVIGAGIAGITASFMLQKNYKVTLFEKDSRLGGHTNTFTLKDGPLAGTGIDTGFIVLNDRNYPLFTQFLADLKVPSRFAEMSYSFSCNTTGLCYGSAGLGAVFADRYNLIRPKFWRLLGDIMRFWKVASRDIESKGIDSAEMANLSVRDYLKENSFSQSFFENYLAPFSASIWSSPPNEIADFPACSMLHFFHNHGMLSWNNQPRWQTVVGGSHSYLKAFEAQFTGNIVRNAHLRSIRRSPGENSKEAPITIIRDSGEPLEFDGVVIAIHADQVLPLLEKPTEEERRLFSVWRYQKNRTILHTDCSFLPPIKKIWSSWNYQREILADGHEPLSITYSMNRLQGLTSNLEYCVTLNPQREPRNAIYEIEYDHPAFTVQSLQSQRELPTIQGTKNTWFCGSYCGYGFHEDGVKAAHAVVSSLVG